MTIYDTVITHRRHVPLDLYVCNARFDHAMQYWINVWVLRHMRYGFLKYFHVRTHANQHMLHFRMHLLEWKRMNFDWKFTALLWRHHGHNSVSNHQPYDCLLRRLFRRRSKQTSKLRVTGLCAGNSPGPVNFPHKWPVTRKMFPFDDVIMGMFRWVLLTIL